MSASEKIILYASESPGIKIVMQLCFTKNGSLYFDGCDTGSIVKGHFGSFDYEYNFTVPPEGVEKLYYLYNLPSGNRELLLITLKDHFGVNEGYSKMTEYMKEHGISYETFFWHD